MEKNNEKGIEKVSQIFCPICSRGVLVENESMYKCKLCNRVVCRPCFDKEHRLCVECNKASHQGIWVPEDLSQQTIMKPEVDGKSYRKMGVWFVISGLVVFSGVTLGSVLVEIPKWLVVILAVGGIYLFVRGIMLLLKD